MLGMVNQSETERLTVILIDSPARTVDEVFRRCQAAEELAKIGFETRSSLTEHLRTLVFHAAVGCGKRYKEEFSFENT